MNLPNPISRGIPKEGSPIHLIRYNSQNVFCGNGSWNIFYQHDREYVTCEKCLEQFKKERC
jgi:hypothetical protein